MATYGLWWARAGCPVWEGGPRAPAAYLSTTGGLSQNLQNRKSVREKTKTTDILESVVGRELETCLHQVVGGADCQSFLGPGPPFHRGFQTKYDFSQIHCLPIYGQRVVRLFKAKSLIAFSFTVETTSFTRRCKGFIYYIMHIQKFILVWKVFLVGST
jgi:hypothetical protein